MEEDGSKKRWEIHRPGPPECFHLFHRDCSAEKAGRCVFHGSAAEPEAFTLLHQSRDVAGVVAVAQEDGLEVGETGLWDSTEPKIIVLGDLVWVGSRIMTAQGGGACHATP